MGCGSASGGDDLTVGERGDRGVGGGGSGEAPVSVRNSADTAVATRIAIVVTPMLTAARSLVLLSRARAMVDTR
jgi:hypothetical protein